MTTLSKAEPTRSLERYMGCFGGYRQDDPVCLRWCALNLRCAIERDQTERFEILEELVSTGEVGITIN